MLFGPVFTAEMVTAGRRARHTITRVLYAGVLFAALWTIYSQYWRFAWQRPTTQQEQAQAAAAFFSTFAVLQLVGVVLIAPAVTAGAIAGERERRTIEYLFATDLSNWEIVLGKLAASLLRSTAFLLVGPPILALAMWMGGVPPAQLLAVFLVAIVTLASVTSLSMAISVWAPRARLATIRCYVYLAILLLLPPFVSAMLAPSLPGIVGYGPWIKTALNWLTWIVEPLVEANPFTAIYHALAEQSPGGGGLWTALRPFLIGHAALTVACVAIAPLAVRRVHLRGASRGPRARTATRKHPVGLDAMRWKELYAEQVSNRLGGLTRAAMILALVVVAGFVMWSYYRVINGYFAASTDSFLWLGGTLNTILLCLVVLFVGARAATAVTSERERDTWITLLSTPLSAGEIVMAKWYGAIYAVRWSLALFAGLWLLMAILRPLYVSVALPLLALPALAAVGFSAALGVWFSLWTSASLRALGATIGSLIIAGGAYMPFLTCCCGWIFFGNGFDDPIRRFVYPHVMSPCLLYLFIFPYPAAWSIEDLFATGRSAQWFDQMLGFVSAYGLGVVGYAIATLVLLRSAVAQFDRYGGRGAAGPLYFSRRLATPAPEIVEVVEVVEAATLAQEQEQEQETVRRQASS